MIGALIFYQGQRIQYLIADRANVAAALSSYEETLDATRAQHRAEIEALRKERNDEIRRLQEAELLIAELQEMGDGPVAPVLRHALDRMRSADDTGEAGQDDNP